MTYMDQSPVQELDVHEGLENTLIVLRHKLKDIVIKRVYNRDLPRITAFGSALNEVWTILLNNAAEALAARGNGTICLRTGQENDYIVVEIADDGPGVPTRSASAPVRTVLHHQERRAGDGFGLERRAAHRGRAASRHNQRGFAPRRHALSGLSAAESPMNTRRGRFYKWASRQESHHRRTHRLHWQYELLEQSWSAEEIHRIDSPDCAQTCLNSIQARHIRSATRRENSSPRTCPKCGSPLQVVNQRDLLEWEYQPLKIGCTNKDCPGYLRPIDERAPFSEIPR